MSIVYNYAVYGIDDRMWWEIMIDAPSYRYYNENNQRDFEITHY